MLPAGKTVAAKAAPLLGTGSIPNRDPALPRDGWLEALYSRLLVLQGSSLCAKPCGLLPLMFRLFY